MIRIRIVEEDYGPGIWGSYIDVKVKDDEQELKVLDLADRRIKRKRRQGSRARESKGNYCYLAPLPSLLSPLLP